MKRRDFVSGLTATFLVGSTICNKLASSETLTRAQRTGYLNLVFHGPFAFAVHGGKILAITPQMEEHEYKVRQRSTELLLQRGKLRLYDVQETVTMPVIDRTKNAVISAHALGISRIDPLHHSYCSVELPFPDQVLAIRSLTAPKIFSEPLGEHLNEIVRQVPNILALGYSFELGKIPKIAGLENLPLNAESQPIDIHFVAEPKEALGEDHTGAAFRKLVALFPGLHFSLSRSFVLHARVVDGNDKIGARQKENVFHPINVSPANCPAPGFFVTDLD